MLENKPAFLWKLYRLTLAGGKFTESVIFKDESLDDLIKFVNSWAQNLGYTFKRDSSIFGGYWVDPANGESYSLHPFLQCD